MTGSIAPSGESDGMVPGAQAAWRCDADQLKRLGLTRHGIQHRIARGRLYPSAGHLCGRQAELTQQGRWMASVLACGGPGMAALSHSSAAALFKIGVEQATGIEVSRRSPDPVRLRASASIAARRCGTAGTGFTKGFR